MYEQSIIRPEHHADHVAIAAVIDAAFRGQDYADGDEAVLVSTLRDENALTVSLVAEFDGNVIGHIAFSPARASDGTEGWFALGPVAVLPEYQRRGVGSQLINAGLEAIRDKGARGCILVGHLAYYPRFGFQSAPKISPRSEFADHFMIKMFDGEEPVGPILFHPAFGADP